MKPSSSRQLAGIALSLWLCVGGASASTKTTLGSKDDESKIVNHVSECEAVKKMAAPSGGPKVLESFTVSWEGGVKMCEVQASLSSIVEVSVVLPLDTWTQRYVQWGGFDQTDGIAFIAKENAHWGAFVAHARLSVKKERNHGHLSPQEKLDVAHLAHHNTAQWVQQHLIPFFYGKRARATYFVGIDGHGEAGRQAMAHAQRYPQDFHGILAANPMLRPGGQVRQTTWNLQQFQKVPSFSKAKLELLAGAVMDECDERDGLQDGIVTDPRTCDFDPIVLQCDDEAEVPSKKEATCLSAAEMQSVRELYKGGEAQNGPVMRGSEPAWTSFLPSDDGSSTKDWVQDMSSVWLVGNEGKPDAMEDASKKPVDGFSLLDGLMGATDVQSLEAFRSRGGKLVIVHAWSNVRVSPMTSVAFFEAAERELGTTETDEFFKLYVVPGKPDQNNNDVWSSGLMEWVEKGTKPFGMIVTTAPTQMSTSSSLSVQARRGRRLSSTHARNTAHRVTRPVYPYPVVAEYEGTGPVSEVSSFRPVTGQSGSSGVAWASEEPGRLLDCIMTTAGDKLSCKPRSQRLRRRKNRTKA